MQSQALLLYPALTTPSSKSLCMFMHELDAVEIASTKACTPLMWLAAEYRVGQAQSAPAAACSWQGAAVWGGP
jgi:hypothetical protein